jgi:hypothetical protein
VPVCVPVCDACCTPPALPSVCCMRPRFQEWLARLASRCKTDCADACDLK